MYVTVAQLVDGSAGLTELAELYTVDAALLAALIAGGATSSWEQDDVEAAQAAVASAMRFIVLADAEVDARLAPRGYAVPLDADAFPVLTVWARAIARYHLHRSRDRTSEETGRIERDYRDALKALDMVAAGKLGLGANDPVMASANDGVLVESAGRFFSRKTLGRL